MKITPLDIRQKTFDKKTFGGYDREEVTAFLQTLSVAWERTLDENKELRMRLDSAEREASKLREVERGLYLTLKTAEDTGNNLIEQANRTSDITIRDAQLKAESISKEAKWQAKNIIDDAEQESKKVYKTLQSEVKRLEQEYRNIENMRDNLLGDLKALTIDIQERAERVQLKSNNVMFLAPSGPKESSSQLEELKKSLSHSDIKFDEAQHEDAQQVDNLSPTAPEEPKPQKDNNQNAEAPSNSYIPPAPSQVFKVQEVDNEEKKGGSFFDQF